ncbi:alpha/beta hydrolase [Leptolyngbyaceae cyanobacterium CCMR0081]|uniref:Alpha/beta hydrolase n=2 Tax=Adonisia TaxID=2950183 RepID=A0A6M0RGQ8_9CYAN|nr:alpha/beta hydrolase [Adonisia turfae CCMR0081]
MFYHCSGNTIRIGNTTMEYVTFGRGDTPLIILPGLSDGLQTVKGNAVTLALYYRLFAQDLRVYVFSRKQDMEEGYSIKDMANNLDKAMGILGIGQAFIFGVSQGGMIAQRLAIDFSDKVSKLVIGVSVARQNQTIQTAIGNWITMAEHGDYRHLIIDTMEKTFTENRLKKYKPFYPILTRVSKPKSFDRFLKQAHACIKHDTYSELPSIQCPTLVIGGDSDNVVGLNSSEEMAEQIRDSKLIIYKGLGHGAYEEARDFNHQVKSFLLHG